MEVLSSSDYLSINQNFDMASYIAGDSIKAKGGEKVYAFTLLTATVLVPFLQLGISFYLSIQVVVILFMVKLLGLKFYVNTILNNTGLLSLFLLAALLSVQGINDILFVLRQILMFCIVVSALMFKPAANSSVFVGYYLKDLLILVVVCEAVICAIQAYYFSKGVYFAIPYQWYVINGGILETSDLALEYGTRFRPVGTYGEPSYLALVANLIFLVLYPSLRSGGRKYVLLTAVICVNILCGSLSGLVFFVAIFMISANSISISKVLMSGAAVTVLLVAAVWGVDEFRARVFDVLLAGEDRSAFVRLEVPFRMVGYVLFSGLGGVYPENIIHGFQDLSADIGYSIDEISDNAALNFVINNGWFGVFIIIGFVVKFYRKLTDLRVAMIIFYSSMQNGNIFSLDKAALIAFLLLVYRYFENGESLKLRNAKKVGSDGR